jgi:hypothetical protein
VAPDRIDAGIEGALAGEELLGFLRRNRDDLLARLTETVRQTWEAVNTRWNMWFMGFSAEDQTALLQRLVISVGLQGGWLLFMVLPPMFIVGVILLSWIRKIEQRKPLEDKVMKIYGRFLNKMARAGIPKAAYQGPLDYGRLVLDRHPELEHDVDVIIGCYIGLRYGQECNLEALKAFRLRVRHFNPRLAPNPASQSMDKSSGGVKDPR